MYLHLSDKESGFKTEGVFKPTGLPSRRVALMPAAARCQCHIQRCGAT